MIQIFSPAIECLSLLRVNAGIHYLVYRVRTVARCFRFSQKRMPDFTLSCNSN